MQQERLRELFEALSAPLVLYARVWCAAPDDAVQEAFIDFANLEAVPECPRAWLYKTTRRKAQNIARSEVRRKTHHERAGQLQDEWFDISRSESELAPSDVIHALNQLERGERELVTARIWGELGYEQLADLLGCSVSSAHRRYHAALSRLRTLMNQQDNGNGRGHESQAAVVNEATSPKQR